MLCIQNATRIIRALFEIALNTEASAILTRRMLTLSKVIEKRLWHTMHPIHQFDLPFEVKEKIEKKHISIEELREMEPKDIGQLSNFIR